MIRARIIHNSMKSLHSLSLKHGTDKCRGTKEGHNYCIFYEEAFAPYRNQPISLLEIGVLGGASMRMWDEYFTKARSIVGVDIQLPQLKGTRKVKLIQGDAYAQGVVDTLGVFDIIIDDGPHTLESQMAAIDLYLPKVKKTGIFVVEDIPNTDWFAILRERVPDDLKDCIKVYDYRSVSNRHDDMLFVVKKSESIQWVA